MRRLRAIVNIQDDAPALVGSKSAAFRQTASRVSCAEFIGARLTGARAPHEGLYPWGKMLKQRREGRTILAFRHGLDQTGPICRSMALWLSAGMADERLRVPRLG
jgi:hypothetical protein